MNQLKKHALTTALLASVFFFTNCSKEAEQVTPQTNENGQNITAPVSKAAPVSKVEKENLAMQYFPKNARKSARTQSIGVTDYVDFNDQMALTILPDYAANTFALAPFYIQQVGTAWVHVKENDGMNYNPGFRSSYGHYHLSYQNFTPCFTGNGQFGKPSGNSCASINPVLEPRTLNTHYGNEWIKIYAYDYTHDSRVFDLLSIRVTNGPIQLWFKKQGGGWWHWSSLGTGTWNTSAYSTDITEVLISGTGSASIGFDDVRVNVPY
jgi:hypothetical protein